ncbi:carboxylesterase family protein [Ammonicoccus fulvus]|uniref:Carboxylic ester hydrolase n=1 Tax=Ammonicoccus fulvus TaxID=3138240 RepID=A0ABZ3FR75_9ACTN
MTGESPFPHWTCPAGEIRGWQDCAVLRATGIRYARAGRYEQPVDEPAATDVIDATHWSPACPQPVAPLLEKLLNRPLGDLVQDEDCLRLSLTLPADLEPGEAVPVIVWIHGGSYTWGAGDAPIFDPAHFVAEQRIIVASVTYRLGVFSYLGVDERPANLGLLDQLSALRWVQANIAAFGGDPGNVTVFGQSAGADAVAHLMIAQGSQGLFHRAVIASAPFGSSGRRDEMYARMAVTAATLPHDAPTADLVEHQARIGASARGFGLRSAVPFGVRFGRAPLPPEAEARAAWRQAATRVPILIGWTSRDGAMFTVPIPALERIAPWPIVGPTAVEVAVRAVTRLVFSAPATAFARRHQRAGGRGYRYELSWGPADNPYRATHTYDMALMFPAETWWDAALIAGATREEILAAGRPVRRMLADFVRTGTVDVRDERGLRVRPLA